jgi:hypothetical protein
MEKIGCRHLNISQNSGISKIEVMYSLANLSNVDLRRRENVKY